MPIERRGGRAAISDALTASDLDRGDVIGGDLAR